ncbi:MAG: hypothetical protein VX343_03635 [Thermodesulfobacteriota bacterium]|nr:hypothetical protein [Thermodesulfobacteriota bacterium]
MENKFILTLIAFLLISYNSSSEVFQASGIFISPKNIQIGNVEMIEQGAGSNFRIHLEGLVPGSYAFYIHEKGLCDTPNFASTGNPIRLGTKDFVTIYVKNNVSKYTGKLKPFNQIIFLRGIYLNPNSEYTILDKNESSIVIQEKTTTGKRVACAVIKKGRLN